MQWRRVSVSDNRLLSLTPICSYCRAAVLREIKVFPLVRVHGIRMDGIAAVVAAPSNCRQKKSPERLDGEVKRGKLGHQPEHLPAANGLSGGENGVRGQATGIIRSDELAVDRLECEELTGRAGAGRLLRLGVSPLLSQLRLSSRWRTGRCDRPTCGTGRAGSGSTPAPSHPKHQGAARSHRFPDSALRACGAQTLFPGQHTVLQRLSVRVRILRHSQSLRPQPAPENARADHSTELDKLLECASSGWLYFVDDHVLY